MGPLVSATASPPLISWDMSGGDAVAATDDSLFQSGSDLKV